MLPELPVARTLDEANALLRPLWEELVRVRAENAALLQRVQELEARLRQTSATSSRPPSSDPPSTPPRPPQRPTGRRRGAQPGHEAYQRLLRPAEQVERVVGHWPLACAHCG